MRAVLRRALICLISAQTALVLTLAGSARAGLGTEHCMDLHFLCITDVFPGICWGRCEPQSVTGNTIFAEAKKERE